MKNELYYGDNLDVLRRKIKDESVDLCYIDPPFNSKRNYFQIYNNQGGEDRAQAQAFVDTWEWGDEAADGLEWIKQVDQLNSGRLTPQTVALIKGLEQVLGQGSLLAYLIHMTLRIVEIHRVLKPTGSFYLHCDGALTKRRFFANRPICTFYLSMKVERPRNQTAWKLAIS
jgi:DNA modification methylase